MSQQAERPQPAAIDLYTRKEPMSAPVEQLDPVVHGREIPNCQGYRVTHDGLVWTCWRTRPAIQGSGRFLSSVWKIKVATAAKRTGHLSVELRRNSLRPRKFLIHRLVLELFVGPCPAGMEGCHKDGDTSNNTLANLYWGTREQNWEDRRRHGRVTRMLGTRNGNAKLTEDAVLLIRKKIGKQSQASIAREFGISKSTMSQIASGKTWKGCAK